MKKLFILSLILILSAVLFTSVFADAEFTATDQTMFVYDDDDNGYFFARVENTGDAGAYVDSGVLEILDENGEVIVTKNYVSTDPSSIWLEPGEYAYVNLYLWESAFLEKTVSDYNYTITPGRWGSEYETIPCEVDFYFNPEDPYNNAVFVTFTNQTEGLIHDYEIVAALYEEEGYLIFTDDMTDYHTAVHPGSTITVQIDMDSSLVKYLGEQGITPVSAEAIVYLEIED